MGGVGARPARADVPPAVLSALLDDLLSHDLATAPHVLARLFRELHGDLPTIREVAAHLTPQQRHGLRALPAPLPLVSPIANEFAALRLSDAERDLLLAVALDLDDGLEQIERFSGLTSAEIASGPAARHLVLHAGRCRLADPRLGIWLRETVPPMVQVEVHARLSTIARELGDEVGADWHWARSSLRGVPATATVLTRIARELSEAGQAERALVLAAEAAAHAFGIDRDEARLVAGMAALGAGYAEDASEWLGSLFPDGAEVFRLQALGGLVVARAHLDGAVPDFAPAAFRPRTDDPADWYAWTRASAFAAVLCAERADRRGMREWLAALRDGCARTGTERELRDPVVALAWLMAGERDLDDAAGSGPLSGGMLRALRAAIDGDIDLGLRALSAGDALTGGEVDPFVAGFEHSPVVLAYRAVTETLLLTWRGDIAVARDRLIRASIELPVAMPFAGLGVVLARRLDLAVTGEIGPVASALTAALPPTARLDHLVDLGIRAHLAGSPDEAASCVRLWLDRGGPRPVFAVPGLDELAQTPADLPDRFVNVEPPGLELARRLRLRVATTEDARWRHERGEIRAAARTLESPFERGRVEVMLGMRSIMRDERSEARAHLKAAGSLFRIAGASAWEQATQMRLARIAGTAPAPAIQGDALSSCREVWERLLTERELEAAMLAVSGASNRDIAESLSVSVRTVEVHLGRVFAKLGVRTRVELTVLAHRTGQHA